MSNPFRRSVASKLPGVESNSSTPSSYPNDTQSRGDDALTTPAQPQTKKKRVKIQSPPDSPELQASPDDRGRRLSASDSAGRADSPPPPAPTAVGNETGGEESDSTATADSDLEEALKNTRRNSGSLPPVGNASQASTMRAPYNPFARTLANRERNAANKEAAQDKSGEQRGAGRPALDVDQFKNILLTGSAAPSPPSAAGATTTGAGISQPRPPDSNSASTDNSSLFDPAYGVHAESPRTSFDDYEDASDNGEGDDTEHSNLMGSDGRLDDLAPPAPPKPQKSRGPQTVSFADFDQTIPPDFISSQRAKSPANPQLTGILRPPMTRSSSDLNKPLPPPPRSPAEPPAPSVPEKDSPAPQQPLPSPTPTDDKKAPPPPPTRRKAPDSGRPRSSSSLSNTTQDSVNSMATSGSAAQIPTPPRTDDTSSKLAPPPPPARKSNSNSQSSTPAVETPPQEPSPSNSTNEVPKAAPTPPPRRHPSKAIRQTPSHSPAGANRQSMKPGDAFLSSLTEGNPNASTSASTGTSANSNNNANAPTNAPPAPPPRRAAGSKRTSLDGRPDTLARRLSTEHHRRSSNNSFDSDRSGSISSLQRGESTEQAVVSPPAEQRDILADMTAFQAEIDALRAQNEKER